MKSLPCFPTASAVLMAQLSLAAPPEIRETLTHELPHRRAIIERAPGMILPDPPEPIVRPAPEPETLERLAKFAAQWRAQQISHPTIHAGASVYRMPDGRTYTHVTNWRVNHSPPVSFWTSADFSILAHSAGFTHSSPDGDVNYTMLLFWSLHDVSRWQAFMKKRDLEYKLPKIPHALKGPATWILDESKKAHKPDAITQQAIVHLHEYHDRNFAKLKEAYAKLEADNAARRAELEANPPLPRDIHLRVSRLSQEQAKAWHQHATGRQESPEQKEKAK
jgi:hypothetical protein